MVEAVSMWDMQRDFAETVGHHRVHRQMTMILITEQDWLLLPQP
jgi:hypothetical protein